MFSKDSLLYNHEDVTHLVYHQKTQAVNFLYEQSIRVLWGRSWRF